MYELTSVTLGRHRSMNAVLDRLHRTYEELGVLVHRIESDSTDAVFHRDVFAWTPWGLIQCRMGKASRAWEPQAWFEAMGVDPVLTVDEPGTFEGADLLWIGEEEVFLASGARTNLDGFKQVRDFLAVRGVLVYELQLPEWHDQHLLGLANWAAGRMWSIEAVYPLPAHHRRWRLPETEVLKNKGSNWVEVGGKILLPAGNPATGSRLRSAGAKTLPINIADLLRHGGGIACASGLLFDGTS